MTNITVICPNCQDQKPIDNLLTAQSNQNVIYKCGNCQYEEKNIQTKKG
ncbi:hypothetical protein [Halalkalibacter alkalisediminis]|uniref:Uncharacterized protein n=1 Tax=Halalkalibacter alkalisediminis TaxID=935616 RepID=A0ABV6NBW0_9BACI|nr:hypothetical protein [Halalkalibacter alkalisediminis]